jgi:protein tyrosine phosphatase
MPPKVTSSSAIDELLGLFDSNPNPNPVKNTNGLALPILPTDSQPNINMLQPIKPAELSINPTATPEKPVLSDTSKLSSSVNLEQSSTQVSSVTKIEAQEVKPKRDEKPIDPVMIEKVATPSTESSKTFSSYKSIDSSSKIDLFLQDYKKLERHIELLSQKTLTSTLTLLEKEWKDLNDYQEKQLEATKYTISVARLYANKNRFHDLLPFDQNRVKLVKPNSKSDDYVNATHFGQLIPSGANSSKSGLTPSFISTQLPVDFSEFWLMVLQEKCELVVCLSKENEFETGFYWPTDKQTPLNVSGLRVYLQSIKETGYSIQRVLTVSLDSTTRTVVLFQYLFNSIKPGAAVGTGLGQNDMPEDVGNFLKFVKDCETFYINEQRNKANPILTHCLNGVSRSAVFMLAFNAIQSIDTFYDESAVNVESPGTTSLAVADLIIKLIKQMRGKRKYMVQTVSHLKYAYECVLFYMKDALIRKNVIKEDVNNDSLVSNNGPKLANASLDTLKKSNTTSAVSSVLTLQDVCDPSKFCLDLNTSGDESRRKIKFTKDDFLQNKNSTLDPFSLIDSLKK